MSGSTSCSWSAVWSSRAVAPRRWSWPARSGWGRATRHGTTASRATCSAADTPVVDRRAAAIRQPRRSQARRRPRCVRGRPERARLPGRRRVDRRLHGRPVAARREPRLRSGRGSRSTRRIAPPGPAGRVDGTNERPRPDRRRRSPNASRSPPSTCRSSRSASSSARSSATLRPAGQVVALVKPQFEAGRGRTDHGVVRDPAIHREVLERTVANGCRRPVWARVTSSPLRSPGPKGNREFLVHLAPGPGCAAIARANRGRDRDAPMTVVADRVRLQPDDRGRRRTERSRGRLVPGPRDRRVAGAVRRHGAAPPGAARRPTRSSSWAATARFSEPPARWPRWTCPLLGINLGKVGFLSKAEATDFEAVLGLIANGEYRIDERMALEGRILRGGTGRPHDVASTPTVRDPSLRAQRRRHRARLARAGLPPRCRDRRFAPGHVHRRRPRRRQPDGLDRLFVLGRRADRRSGEPEPHRHPDRGVPVVDPFRRREPDTRSSAARSSTPTRRSSRSTVARTCRLPSATSSRSGRSSSRSG